MARKKPLLTYPEHIELAYKLVAIDDLLMQVRSQLYGRVPKSSITGRKLQQMTDGIGILRSEMDNQFDRDVGDLMYSEKVYYPSNRPLLRRGK